MYRFLMLPGLREGCGVWRSGGSRELEVDVGARELRKMAI